MASGVFGQIPKAAKYNRRHMGDTYPFREADTRQGYHKVLKMTVDA